MLELVDKIRLMALVLMEFITIVLKAMGCYFHYCPCEEAYRSLTDNEIMRGIKKREQDQMRKEYIQQRYTKLLKCGSAIA